MSDNPIDAFVARQRLPPAYRELIARELPKLSDWIRDIKPPRTACLVGISGAQGTGKTTLAQLIKTSLAASMGWRAIVLSLDDFYLTRSERARLAREVHPLLATRGVPGTHDVSLLKQVLEELLGGAGTTLNAPVFDKATDDRAPVGDWQVITGPVDLVILEGWCMGSMPQHDSALAEPINALERERDDDGRWRHYVNQQLSEGYASLFAMLDALVYLQAPDFEAVARWRWLQEQRLADDKSGAAIMSREQLGDFLQHFERLTRHCMATLLARADVVITLDDDHRVGSSRYPQRR